VRSRKKLAKRSNRGTPSSSAGNSPSNRKSNSLSSKGSPSSSPAAKNDSPSAAKPSSSAEPQAPAKLGLKRHDFINIHRKDVTARIELVQGPVDKLGTEDETDLLIIYLRKKGDHKAHRDSGLAALNRTGLKLEELEKDSKPNPSYRRHYHCWLSRPLRNRPAGFEYKRVMVYEDPGGELTRDDHFLLDIMKCLTTVLGGDAHVSTVLIPLSGALLSPHLRNHFVKAVTQISIGYLQMGLPITNVKILLAPGEIDKEMETFRKIKEKVEKTSEMVIKVDIQYDVFFSYAYGDKDAAHKMMEYLRSHNPAVRIYDHEPSKENNNIRERGIMDKQMTEAISQSRIYVALLSDDYFHSNECTESFSIAYCRDFENQGSFIIPLFWKTCDLTPLARRLVATEGVDCRDASHERATALLDEILSALENLEKAKDNADGDDGHGSIVAHDRGKMDIAERLMMAGARGEEQNLLFGDEDGKKAVVQDMPEHPFFKKEWVDKFGQDISSIVFGPRIGAGGFGEVYKCKWDSKMVAVKTLQEVEEEDPNAVYAEFMVEMKLMSKLEHANVVTFLGACVTPPRLAIILEFMPGGSLYRAIHRRRRNNNGPFPKLKSLWIAFGIAKGMTYLHNQNPCVVHRDLKSPNILLGTNVREVKVTDFGLSRLRVNSFVNTGPGGTPEWMAPELLRQDPFDEQSDVYSFGVILWELWMCEKPWKDDHPMQIVFKVGSRGEKLALPPPSKCIPEIREMIQKCLEDGPKTRPRFSELATSLHELTIKHNPKKAAE